MEAPGRGCHFACSVVRSSQVEKCYLLGNKSALDTLMSNPARPLGPAKEKGCLYDKNKVQFSLCSLKWAQSPRPIKA